MTRLEPADCVLLAIKPRHASAILAGRKTAELRRRLPRVGAGATLVLYASSPVCAIVGMCRVVRTEQARERDKRLDMLWAHVAHACCVTRAEFQAYFASTGRSHGAPRHPGALWIAAPSPLRSPISLETLRAIMPTFQPPQSYRMLRSSSAADAAILNLLTTTIRPARRGRATPSSTNLRPRPLAHNAA